MLVFQVCKQSKVVPYSITSFGYGADSCSTGDIYKPSGRLPLLSTRPAVTLQANEIIPRGRYQIILIGDRGTQVLVACPRPLCNGAQRGLEAATCKLQILCPTNSPTASGLCGLKLRSVFWPIGFRGLTGQFLC